MLPTPAKFHYIFNLRDLSRIWEGMLKIKGDECSDVRTMLGLWKHECTRVIADRFVPGGRHSVSMFQIYWFKSCLFLVTFRNVVLWSMFWLSNFVCRWQDCLSESCWFECFTLDCSLSFLFIANLVIENMQLALNAWKTPVSLLYLYWLSAILWFCG